MAATKESQMKTGACRGCDKVNYLEDGYCPRCLEEVQNVKPIQADRPYTDDIRSDFIIAIGVVWIACVGVFLWRMLT